MINNKTCTRCVNDRTIKNIKFDKNGVCNFCKTYDEYAARLHDYENLEKLFLKKVNNVDGDFDYDVAVGFSGGKDSTYVLYKLVKVYKLKCIAYTLDNGFLSKEARDKIDQIVKELNVEHEYVTCDMELLKKSYKYIVNKYLSPCIACSFLGYASMINYASKVNARVGIHGRSIYQMLRNFSNDTDDVFKPFILSGLEDTVDLDKLFNDIITKIDFLVDKKLADEIKSKLLNDAFKNGYRDFIPYFLYHPYNKDEIIHFLKQNTSWSPKKDAEHFDCLIHNGALYLKDLTARRGHLMPEYSVMIREGALTKAEAYKELKHKTNPDVAKKELKMLCNYANINYTKIMFKAKIYNKRWW